MDKNWIAATICLLISTILNAAVLLSLGFQFFNFGITLVSVGLLILNVLSVKKSEKEFLFKKDAAAQENGI